VQSATLFPSAAVGVAAFFGSLLLAQPAFAQYMGSNFHGDFGVNSGSQAGPGLYVGIPFAQWNVDYIKDADGNTVVGGQFQGFDVRTSRAPKKSRLRYAAIGECPDDGIIAKTLAV
jgi:hypothetical protein